jgi:cell division protein FtsQ
MPEGQATLKFGARSVKVRRKGDARNLPPLRFWLIAGAMVIGVSLAVVLFFRAEGVLIRDGRFALSGPPDPGQELPGFQLRGLRHASRERVMQVFDRDFGRSVYMLPLRQRREQLLRVEWIREAAIYRVWPNRIEVEVQEREPVAFAQLPALTTDGSYAYTYSLIDSEGVLLPPPGKAEYRLPVLTGIRLRDTQALRRERVRQMQRLLAEAGELGRKLSEIDAADVHNLVGTVEYNGRALALMLGDRNFKLRLENFFQHFPVIDKKAPGATTLDLRLEDRITVVESKNRDKDSSKGSQ